MFTIIFYIIGIHFCNYKILCLLLKYVENKIKLKNENSSTHNHHSEKT